MEDRKITLFVDGKEIVMNVLFTFHHDETNSEYVLIYEEGNDENVMLFRIVDEQNLEPIDDEEDPIWDVAQELLDMYDEEQLDKVELNN